MEPPVGFTPTSLSSTDNALFLELQRLMVTLVGIEPNMTRMKISYPEPLDDRAIVIVQWA
jgi:hypothetical protein